MVILAGHWYGMVLEYLGSDLEIQGPVWKTPVPTLSSEFVVARCLSALNHVMFLEVMIIIR